MIRQDHKLAASVAAVLVALGAYSVSTLKPLSGVQQAQVLRIQWAKAPQQVVSRGMSTAELIVPVEGVDRKALRDSWGAPRDGGRTHKGIDIRAAQGTPVVATASGRIIKLYQSSRGGTTVYQIDETGRFIFYYAHLEHYAAGLSIGQHVAQGDTIAYVGQTGNAPFPHLHFEIQRPNATKQWWRGEAFDPYPVLVAGRTDIARGATLSRMN